LRRKGTSGHAWGNGLQKCIIEFRFIGVRHLSLSPLNVRKTGGDSGIEQLADLIAAEGILQNLDVYESEEGEGKKKTTHAVVAGGRRWRALQLLIRQKRIKPDYAVPCLVVGHERAVQISLAENSGREPMHPADEFDAFRQLIDAGQSVEDVAARFGVAPLVVQRRLKLANVCPTFITLYREGEITLEHLMALAVSDDHARQQQVWDSLQPYERHPNALRRLAFLREAVVEQPANPAPTKVRMNAHEVNVTRAGRGDPIGSPPFRAGNQEAQQEADHLGPLLHDQR